MIAKVLIWLLTTCFLVTVSIADAQPTKIHRVGILGPPGNLEERLPIKGLRDGLKEAGYVEGRNLLLNISTVRFDICECRVSLEKQVINRRKWISTI